MKRYVFLPILLAGITLFVSCKKDEVTPEPTTTAKEYKNLSVQGSGWVYFSFEKNAIVEVANPETSTEWDIAFDDVNIKTRGALNTKNTNFTSILEAPTEGYIADEDRVTFSKETRKTVRKLSSAQMSMGYSDRFIDFIKNLNAFEGLSEEQIKAIRAKLVHDNGWATFVGYGANGLEVIPNNWVYAVKTAKGKYAKIQILSYSDEKNRPFHISFKYQIANDNRKF